MLCRVQPTSKDKALAGYTAAIIAADKLARLEPPGLTSSCWQSPTRARFASGSYAPALCSPGPIAAAPGDVWPSRGAPPSGVLSKGALHLLTQSIAPKSNRVKNVAWGYACSPRRVRQSVQISSAYCFRGASATKERRISYRAKSLKSWRRPTRFERVTFAFGGHRGCLSASIGVRRRHSRVLKIQHCCPYHCMGVHGSLRPSPGHFRDTD